MPDWAFRHLKQGKHIITVNHDAKYWKIQSGYWDDSILCKECDNYIGDFDTYAKSFFDRDFTKSTIVDPNTREEAAYILVKDFDYQKLWFFITSILWRASITSRPQFVAVSLGSYENKIKVMLKNKIITDEEYIQIVFVRPDVDKSGLFQKSILTPLRRRFGSALCYSFVMAGFEIVVKLSKQSSSLHAPEFVLQPNSFAVISTTFEEATLGKYLVQMKKKYREKFKDSAPA